MALNVCKCGCGQECAKNFRPGHDQRLFGFLVQEHGFEAAHREKMAGGVLHALNELGLTGVHISKPPPSKKLPKAPEAKKRAAPKKAARRGKRSKA